MCGRYVTRDEAAIEREFKLPRRHNPLRHLNLYNVAPSSIVPIIRREPFGEYLELGEARWGLIPSWWKDSKLPSHTINARSEDAASKPMWRVPYRNARCLVPSVGWYEWKPVEVTDTKTGEVSTIKQPHFIFLPGHRLFCFAGLMSLWAPPDQEPLLTCTILTRPASSSAAEVYDRMPVVLRDSVHEAWCDPELTDEERVAEMIAQAVGDVQHYAVSTRVNSPRAEGAELIEPIEKG